MFCFDNSFFSGISCLVEVDDSARQSYALEKGDEGRERYLVPVWAVRAAIAVTLGVKRTYMWPVALIVRLRPRQLLQHLPASRRRPTVIQLILASGKLHMGVQNTL